RGTSSVSSSGRRRSREKGVLGMSEAEERFRGSVLAALRSRRSHPRLVEPGPRYEDLRSILEAGACAPDHGKLRPMRFVILRGEGRTAFGRVLEDAYLRRCAEA